MLCQVLSRRPGDFLLKKRARTKDMPGLDFLVSNLRKPDQGLSYVLDEQREQEPLAGWQEVCHLGPDSRQRGSASSP